jgi:hypothetical protein
MVGRRVGLGVVGLRVGFGVGGGLAVGIRVGGFKATPFSSNLTQPESRNEYPISLEAFLYLVTLATSVQFCPKELIMILPSKRKLL